MRSTNFMPPPITLSAPRPKILYPITNVGVQLYLPLIDGPTVYIFQEKIQLVQEYGPTSLFSEKTTI
jgi:hypothetical protein